MVRTLKGTPITCRPSPSAVTGRWIATASYDGTASVWDAETGELRQTLKGHRGAVLSVAFSIDGRMLATGGIDGDIRLWDPLYGKPFAVLRGTSRG